MEEQKAEVPAKKNLLGGLTKTKKIVRSIIALICLVWSGMFLWQYSFTVAEKMNPDAKFVAGFVTGTLVTLIISFYFGSSEKEDSATEDKQKQEDESNA